MSTKKKIILTVFLAVFVVLNIIFLTRPVLSVGSYKGVEKGTYSNSYYDMGVDRTVTNSGSFSIKIKYEFKHGLYYSTSENNYPNYKNYNVYYNQGIYRVVNKEIFLGDYQIKNGNGTNTYYTRTINNSETRGADLICKSVFCIESENTNENINNGKNISYVNSFAIFIQIILGVGIITCIVLLVYPKIRQSFNRKNDIN